MCYPPALGAQLKKNYIPVRAYRDTHQYNRHQAPIYYQPVYIHRARGGVREVV